MPLHQQLFALLCLATCIYAVGWGGAPERITACAFIVAFVLTNVFQTPHARIYLFFEWRIALIDTALLLAVGAVGLFSTRYWGIPMTSMQLVDVSGHAAKVLDPHVLPSAYFALVTLISFPMVLTLGFGVWFHRQRLRRFGVDYAWASELPLLYLTSGWLADERTERKSLGDPGARAEGHGAALERNS